MKKLLDLIKSGDIISFNLDEKSEKLVIVFPSGETLQIETFCGDCHDSDDSYLILKD